VATIRECDRRTDTGRRLSLYNTTLGIASRQKTDTTKSSGWSFTLYTTFVSCRECVNCCIHICWCAHWLSNSNCCLPPIAPAWTIEHCGVGCELNGRRLCRFVLQSETWHCQQRTYVTPCVGRVLFMYARVQRWAQWVWGSDGQISNQISNPETTKRL